MDESDMRFKRGQMVALKEAHPILDLKAGDIGIVVIGCPMPSRPFYEVTFHGPDGKPFDVSMYDEEIEPVLELKQ